MTPRVKVLLAALALAVLGGAAVLFAFPDRTSALGRPHQHMTTAEIEIYGVALHTYLTTDGLGADRGGPIFVVGQLAGADRPVDAEDRDRIAGVAAVPISFVNAQDDVLVRDDGCARVRDHGIAVTLTRLRVTGRSRVEVPVYGFEACLGASMLTYVVEYSDGHWRVAGDTGVYGIS